MEIYDKNELTKRPLYDYMSNITPIKDGIPPIAISDSDINIHDVVIIQSKAYRIEYVLSRPNGEKWAIADRLPNENNFISDDISETEFSPTMKCPYCGHEVKDSWTYQRQGDNVICQHCHSLFEYERKIEISYKTKPISRVTVHNL